MTQEQELIVVSNNIKKIIGEIGEHRRKLESLGKEKARAISNYDKKIAIALIALRDGELYKVGTKTIQQPPVTIMEKIAKGGCSEERYAMELAEGSYKACISNMTALLAQLNAHQSIFRHLQEA